MPNAILSASHFGTVVMTFVCACSPSVAAFDAGEDAGGLSPRDANIDSSIQPPLDASIDPCSIRPGLTGGQCPSGRCAAGVDCFVEVRAHSPWLRGVSDPGRRGECAAGDWFDIPDLFAPGSLCSQPCNPSDEIVACGDCATCTTAVGGPRTGVGASLFALDVARHTSPELPGICRPRCSVDPSRATNGGCPVGYTCDPVEGACLEGCVSDEQCNLGWCRSRADGLLVETDGPAFCNAATDSCEWMPPSSATLGSPCSDDLDCPSPIGRCMHGGVCTTYACDLLDPSDPTGSTLAYPCGDGYVCALFGGSSLCLRTCVRHDDCPDGFGCQDLEGLHVCSGLCGSDSDCKASARCDLSVPEAGRCRAFCGPLPDAIDCPSGESCEMVTGGTHGFCEALGRLCWADSECHGTQGRSPVRC